MLPILERSGAVVGRSRDCDIVLTDSNVSRRHAEISLRDGSWSIADLGSTNGTYLNGESLDGPQPLHPGDRIRIGDNEFSFET